MNGRYGRATHEEGALEPLFDTLKMEGAAGLAPRGGLQHAVHLDDRDEGVGHALATHHPPPGDA